MIVFLAYVLKRIIIILKEFKEFAVKGTVVDMAVGVIVGGAFTGVVNGLQSTTTKQCPFSLFV